MRYEYQTIFLDLTNTTDMQTLNKLGHIGWHVVSVGTSVNMKTNQNMILLERPLIPTI